MAEQSIPNGLKIGNVNEISLSEKIAVFGELDSNGIRKVGYIKREDLGGGGIIPEGIPTLQQVAEKGNTFNGNIQILPGVNENDGIVLSQINTFISAENYDYAQIVELTINF